MEITVFSPEKSYFKTTKDRGLSVNRLTADDEVNTSNVGYDVSRMNTGGHVIPVLNVDGQSGSCFKCEY